MTRRLWSSPQSSCSDPGLPTGRMCIAARSKEEVADFRCRSPWHCVQDAPSGGVRRGAARRPLHPRQRSPSHLRPINPERILDLASSNAGSVAPRDPNPRTTQSTFTGTLECHDRSRTGSRGIAGASAVFDRSYGEVKSESLLLPGRRYADGVAREPDTHTFANRMETEPDPLARLRFPEPASIREVWPHDARTPFQAVARQELHVLDVLNLRKPTWPNKPTPPILRTGHRRATRRVAIDRVAMAVIGRARRSNPSRIEVGDPALQCLPGCRWRPRRCGR